MSRSWEEMLSNPVEGEKLSGLSTLEELEVLVICEDCMGKTEWKDCDIHPEVEWCYRVVCDDCGWVSRDCDTTEHEEVA